MALPDVFKNKYGSWTNLTITMASLASDANLLAGRESTAVDNTGDLFQDAKLAGKFTTGTSPTAGTVEVWGYGEWTAASTYPDVLDGTDSNETITSADIKNEVMRLLISMVTDTTSNREYPYEVGSLAMAFGFMPTRWGIFLAHDTVAAANSTAGNHKHSYLGLHHQITDT